MEFKFKSEIIITLGYEKWGNTSKLLSTGLKLTVDKKVDKSKYLDKENMPTAEGSKALSNVLIQGLVGNIHMAHQSGFRDSAEHLRYIISELERGFIRNVNVRQSYFDK